MDMQGEPAELSMTEAVRWTAHLATPLQFCHWRALLGVAAVSFLATALILLGRLGSAPPIAPALPVVFGVSLGLFCAICLCLFRGLLERLSTRVAWSLSWLIVVLAAWLYSYGVGVVTTVLGFGPGRDGVFVLVLQSVLAVAIVSVALFRYLFVRAQWQAEMLSEAEARVQALQSRIRPHFLFNSLNTIAALIPQDPGRAERATENLADLFRAGMRRADERVPLSDELAMARRYLAMEQDRLGHRLRVEWDVDQLPESFPVPHLILQPLLENAVAHGIQTRPEGGEVRLFGRLEGARLVITVVNPLPGQPATGGAGMALHNIRSRLALMYGADASLVTDQDKDCFYAVLALPGPP